MKIKKFGGLLCVLSLGFQMVGPSFARAEETYLLNNEESNIQPLQVQEKLDKEEIRKACNGMYDAAHEWYSFKTHFFSSGLCEFVFYLKAQEDKEKIKKIKGIYQSIKNKCQDEICLRAIRDVKQHALRIRKGNFYDFWERLSAFPLFPSRSKLDQLEKALAGK
jgi:hypothetical protein